MIDRYLGQLTEMTLFKYGVILYRKLRAFWEWLISPSIPIQQPDLLRQSRLLAALLAVVVSLTLLVEILTIVFTRYQWSIGHILTFVFLLLLGLAFVLNRFGHLLASVWITVAIQSFAIFILTFFTEGQPVEIDFLSFLFVPLLFASVFLSERMILVLAGLYFLGFFASDFIPGIDVVQVFLGPASFIIIACGMIYLIFHHRNVLEADRQRELVEKEERYRTLLETSYEGISIISDGKILEANPNFTRMFGYRSSELVGKSILALLPQADQPGILPAMQSVKGHPSKIPVYRKDGTPFYIETVSRMQTYHGHPAQVIAIRDITERVQAEDALDQNERLYRTLFEGANDAIFLLSFENTHIAANQKAADLLGYTVQELISKDVSDVVAPGEYPDSIKVKNDLLMGQTPPLYERTFCKKDGSEFPAEINATLVRDREGKPLFIQSIVRDISERKLAEERIHRQLERLKALREIDLMITASLDLQATLDTLLNHVQAQLGIDAANILLLDPHFHHLEYSTGLGFHPGTVGREPIRLYDMLAGRAALDGRMVEMMDLNAAAEGCPRLESLTRQGFMVGIAVPLIAKGQVKGVLEVFCRKPFETSPEWIDFLETLCGQAAIAIDSSQLFQNLQRSNMDLIRAYDATLEGWAKALELRDKETEGHSQRVTDMTMRLGRTFGITNAQMVHLRRGALLHDIGKMGMPDSILLKPGPLNDEEWEVMKQHPVYANEMLASIPFLDLARDIPYYHHERWDGSGYPMGLKGENIPLAARIFAVVDVWDALTSDRPYRQRWSKEKTREYLRSQAGVLFDPRAW